MREEEGALKRKKGLKGKGKEEREIGSRALLPVVGHSIGLVLSFCDYYAYIIFFFLSFVFPCGLVFNVLSMMLWGPSHLESEENLEPSWNHVGRGRIQCMVHTLNIQCVYIII